MFAYTWQERSMPKNVSTIQPPKSMHIATQCFIGWTSMTVKTNLKTLLKTADKNGVIKGSAFK